MNFLMALFTLLWALLFIVPGIIKSISYSFVPYILMDNPELSGIEAIERSKQMTEGYKMDLFVLGLSFIGWYLLSIVTLGVALIYALPYIATTYANAYNEIKGATIDTTDNKLLNDYI